MLQATFLALIGMALLGLLLGSFKGAALPQRPFFPTQLTMDNGEDVLTETSSHQKSDQINIMTSRGVLQVRKQMDDLAQEQDKILKTVKDQQLALKNAHKETRALVSMAKQDGPKAKDILQLEVLASEMQDEQRLLVARGQDLVLLNDQLARNRKWVSQQVSSANINTEATLQALQQRYSLVKYQASGFFNKVTEQNQQISDQMDELQGKMRDIVNNTSDLVLQQKARECVQGMMDKENEDIVLLADCVKRNSDFLQDNREIVAAQEEQSSDSKERAQDLIDDDRQKAEDRESIIQERISDQRQRMEDKL